MPLNGTRSGNCKRVTLLERNFILLYVAVYTIVWFRLALQMRSLDHGPGIVWLSGAVVKDFKYAADLEIISKGRAGNVEMRNELTWPGEKKIAPSWSPMLP